MNRHTAVAMATLATVTTVSAAAIAQAASPGYLSQITSADNTSIAWTVHSPVVSSTAKQTWTLSFTAGAGQTIDCSSLRTVLYTPMHTQAITPSQQTCDGHQASVTVAVNSSMIGSSVDFSGRNTITDATLGTWSNTARWNGGKAGTRDYTATSGVFVTPTPTTPPTTTTPPETTPTEPTPTPTPTPAPTIPPFTAGTGDAAVTEWHTWATPETWMNKMDYLRWTFRSPVITQDMVGKTMIFQAVTTSEGHVFDCGTAGGGYSGANGWVNTTAPVCTPTHIYQEVVITQDMVGKSVQMGAVNTVTSTTPETYTMTAAWTLDGVQTDLPITFTKGAIA